MVSLLIVHWQLNRNFTLCYNITSERRRWKVNEEYMPTDVQFKYELRKHLTELERKLELLRNEEYEKLEKEYLKEIQDIQTSLED